MIPMDVDLPEKPKVEIIHEKKVNSPINYNLIFSKTRSLAAIVKISPKDRNQTYTQLRRTQEDEDKIDDLIYTMGSNGKIVLLFQHEKRLRIIGDELRPVHPLKFIGYIFSKHKPEDKPDLQTQMGNVFDDYFKRSNFVKDYAQTMDIFDLKNALVKYINDFSKEVDVSPDKIMPFINDKDWEGLLKFLITN